MESVRLYFTLWPSCLLQALPKATYRVVGTDCGYLQHALAAWSRHWLKLLTARPYAWSKYKLRLLKACPYAWSKNWLRLLTACPYAWSKNGLKLFTVCPYSMPSTD